MGTTYQSQPELGRLITDAIQQLNGGSDAPARLNGDTARAVARESAGPDEPFAQPKQRARLDHGPASFGGPISCRGQGPVDCDRKTTSGPSDGNIVKQNGKHVGTVKRGSALSRGRAAIGRQMARAWSIVDRALVIQNRSGAMIAVCAAVLIFIF